EEVYRHPANPFVYNFLGNANFFHGRLHQGRMRIGALEIDAPEHADAIDAAAVGYVRPHDIEIDRRRTGAGMIEAVVRRVSPVGPWVRFELVRRESGERIEAELTRDRYNDLRLKEGEHVFVKPRNLRFFLKDVPSDSDNG
ncbi:MAG TPA: TOBE-like domain-containing protein, partial [Candidatus Manganitrophaceae bacterium]|nr:TOBE-like domain-containing protein [Candidatus Manganitrophaceae bacterium]